MTASAQDGAACIVIQHNLLLFPKQMFNKVDLDLNCHLIFAVRGYAPDINVNDVLQHIMKITTDQKKMSINNSHSSVSITLPFITNK